MSEYTLPPGYIDLITRRYNIEVIDHHYILVDEKFHKYNLMLDIVLNDSMLEQFKEKYSDLDECMNVSFHENKATNSIRFYAEAGNNILLLLDTLTNE